MGSPAYSTSQNYIPTLDGWRAIAISMVLFCHLRLPGNALQGIAGYGALGVHLFFAISGFLITGQLLHEASTRGAIDLRAFYIRRAFRILPAALLYLGVLSLLGFAFGSIPLNAGQIWSSVFFFRNYYVLPAASSWYTGHFWSLSVEEHFYLLWPGLLVGLGVARARWAVPILAISIAIWRALDSHFGWIAAINPAWQDLVERTDYRLDGLLWGCAAAFIWHSPALRKWLAKRGRSEYALIAIAAMALCLIGKPPGYVALLAILMPLPLLFTSAHAGNWIGRTLESRPFRWFGRISYSVYLWQMLFLTAYGIPVSLGSAQRLPWNLLFALTAACLSYYLIEQPLRRVGRKLAARYLPVITSPVVALTKTA